MELGPISLLDCLVFIVLLIPQLLLHAPWVGLLSCALTTLPRLLLWLPYTLMFDCLPSKKVDKPAFVRNASLFQLLIIRCVRFAFANMPTSIGKVFFSRSVALPFFTFRRLRHGHRKQGNVYWKEIDEANVKGLWIIHDAAQKPDVALMYSHGGGFSMGSSYFYMEYLLALVTRLKQSGFENPALFALDYTLVPQASFPTQLDEAKRGYAFVLSKIGPCPICLAGDSAGATLTMSLLLALTNNDIAGPRRPNQAILISPWPVMQSRTIHDSLIDFLNVETLYQYGQQYVGRAEAGSELVSPGCCRDLERWKKACPDEGFIIVYGKDEVLAPDIESMIDTLQKVDDKLHVVVEQAWAIHAWPVVKLYLGGSAHERYHGITHMANLMYERLSGPSPVSARQ